MGDEHEKDSRAAAALLEEHGAALARVCMALLGDPSEVERALEAVARELGAKRAAPEGTTPRAWVFGLARAACAARLSKVPLRKNEGASDGPTTERLGARDAVPARTVLAQLKPTEREAVVLHVVGGLDAADVAAASGVDLDTARSRIARGMLQLAASKGGAR